MTSECVLLIGMRSEMSNHLASRLRSKAHPVIMSSVDCLSAQYFVASCRNGLGAIRLASGRQIQLRDVIGTYAEDILNIQTSDTDLSNLLRSELTALLSYIRLVSPNCVNPPRNGSLTSFCESIMHQWMLVDSLTLGFRVPSWRLEHPNGLGMYVPNPFDYRFPGHCQASGLVVSLDAPSGVRASCLFCEARQWHCVQASSGSWRHIPTTPYFSGMFRDLIRALRNEYSIEVGVINYFYSGFVTFWSVSPIPDVERFPSIVTENFLDSVIQRLTAEKPKHAVSGSSIAITTRKRNIKPASHPLLEGYRWRLNRTTVTGSHAEFLPTVPSPPYVALVSSAFDPTASHLFSVANLLDRKVYWITYESLAAHPKEFEQIRENLDSATGTLVRHAIPLSDSIFTAQLSIGSVLHHLDNVIAPSKESTNWSKPVHTWILSQKGFGVPDSTIGSDAPLSLSVAKGMGALPTLAYDADQIQSDFPLMFQELQQGIQIRVHVIDQQVISHQIISSCLDYRRDGKSEIVRYDLPRCDRQRMIELTVAEKLRFSGIDLIYRNEQVAILEVNPMPGYHSYEGQDREISVAVLDALGEKSDSSQSPPT